MVNQKDIVIKLPEEERKYYAACDRLATCEIELSDLFDMCLIDLAMDVLLFPAETDEYILDYWGDECREMLRSNASIEEIADWLERESLIEREDK